MKIIKNIDKIPVLKNPVITVGSFDGVHLGHKAIIQITASLARQIDGNSVAITFFPHPQTIIHPEIEISILNTLEEKSQKLEALEIDYLLIIPFTKEFSSMPYNDFIKNFIVERLHAKALVIGYDHHFGSKREGSIKHLRQLGSEYSFKVEEVPAQNVNGTTISSTKIRKALIAGDISTANLYLGYEYSISGNVIKGNGLGKQLGFPTANIEFKEKEKLLPAYGVYAMKVDVGGNSYIGMLNTGVRPTIGGLARVTEINIFDFSKDIYGEKIRVHFMERIRNEMKFAGMTELKEQLLKDKENVLKIFSYKKS